MTAKRGYQTDPLGGVAAGVFISRGAPREGVAHLSIRGEIPVFQSFFSRGNLRYLSSSDRTELLVRFANRGLAGPVRLRFVILLGFICFAIPLVAEQPYASPPDSESSSSSSPAPLTSEQRRQRAAEEVKAEEHQRILRVVPNFNTTDIADAEPLSPGQKFQLAVKGGLDPFSFVAVGIDAGISQAENNFASYGQGAKGYGKRFAASFADSFDGEILGNALLPVLLKQDPRYFRKGTGSFRSRFTYAMISTVKCKNDNGRWGPNYSNILGNFAAGGISNLYYPAPDRGVRLTAERALVDTAEGTLGAVFVEFWPDISSRLFHRHRSTDFR